MKQINFVAPSVERLDDPDIFKMIELAGRTCYKSEDKITDDSAKKFVQRMIASKHMAMLEHGTVYMTVPIPFGKAAGVCDDTSEEWKLLDYFSKNPYSIVRCTSPSLFYEAKGFITTNYRVIVENDKLEEYEKYKSECTEFHKKRISFKIVTNRQVSHELVRSRKFSFAQESTRYCDYTKDKFRGLTFVIPSFLKDKPYNCKEMFDFKDYMQWVSDAYFNLRKLELPQNCALLLPNALKTELVMTGFLDDWNYFLDLRYYEKTGKVHPDMKVISTMINTEIEKIKNQKKNGKCKGTDKDKKGL